jgi:hypothetical protein
VCSIMQSLGAESVHIRLKSCIIPHETSDHLVPFFRGLSGVRILVREVKYPREDLGFKGLQILNDRTVNCFSLRVNWEVTYPESIITLDVMGGRVCTNQVLECASDDRDIRGRVWKCPQPDYWVVAPDTSMLDILIVC